MSQPHLVDDLTAREREVLTHIAEGLMDKQIADKLGVSVRTIEVYGARIVTKLGVKRRIQAAVLAAKAGLV